MMWMLRSLVNRMGLIGSGITHDEKRSVYERIFAFRSAVL